MAVQQQMFIAVVQLNFQTDDIKKKVVVVSTYNIYWLLQRKYIGSYSIFI